MKGISYAFFVTETEYARLQSVFPGEFPLDYAQYSARVNRDIREAAATVAIEKVYVSVDRFLAWCAENRLQPSNLSRARYAAHVGHPRGMLNEDL